MKKLTANTKNSVAGSINCKKHSKHPHITFSVNDSIAGQWSIKVCFKCYVEKATKGLQVFK